MPNNNKHKLYVLSYYTITVNGKLHILFVCDDINAGVVKGGGLCKEWSDDGHGSRDGLGVTKRCPETNHGVWRPGNQKHDDHHYGHLPVITKQKYIYKKYIIPIVEMFCFKHNNIFHWTAFLMGL